ncbi:MAG: nicotinate-nucleotide--dimethylbenzimidazole phosphoribosyltransferase [Granulosicoccus sp.]
MATSDKGNPVSSEAVRQAAQEAIDNKTKPPGSLGLIEQLAVQVASIQQTLKPCVDPARIIVFAADHGVTVEGVSAFPAEVTQQMMANFASGGAAVRVLCKSAGAQFEAVDVGVDGDLSGLAGVVHAKVATGTSNLAKEAAMTHEQLDAALQVGREAIVRAVKDGIRCVGLGEMGIGNTTSAAVLTGLLCDAESATVTGRGTGLDNEQLSAKQEIVANAMNRLASINNDPMECLREAGGLEIAAIVGAMLEAPAHRMTVIVDGFIVTSAALVACRLKPSAREMFVFAHQSAEAGHGVALTELRAEPLLNLGLRLGEGSATALALPLIRSAVAVLNDMASFSDAGVSTQHDF